MHRLLQLGLIVALAATQLPAAEVANLRNGFSIRHESHETQGESTRLYLTSETSGSYVDIATAQIESFEAAPTEPVTSHLTSSTRDLPSIIGDASSRSQVDADFIASVIRAESGGNPKAVSPKGARGLMQLMPQTASTLGVR